MAVFVYKSALVSIDTAATDLSAYVHSATINRSVETPDGTAMDDTNRKVLAGGLQVWSVDVEFYSELTDGAYVEALLDAIMTTADTVVVSPTGAGPSASNPTFTASCICESYAPCSGSVGDRAMITAHFVPTGLVAWARA